MEENRILKHQRSLVDRENLKLESELSSTRDELQLTKEDLVATRDENTRLKKELTELRSNLTRLAQMPDFFRTGGNESGTSSTKPAPLEDATPAPPTSNDTSNFSSQDEAAT
jgi:regulator of replication initiation timing